jgi:hypothetical protein
MRSRAYLQLLHLSVRQGTRDLKRLWARKIVDGGTGFLDRRCLQSSP